jgi:phosphotransferase system  glucose/maltose/N-acetylglucosamine-specific IIC component
MATIQDRVIRAARLDVRLYEEVEADRDATGQAIAVVVLSAVAAGIGNLGSGGLPGIVVGTIAALVGWLVWAFLTYFIGTRLLPEPQTKADYGELLRTIGFASSPGLIRVFGVIPGIAPILFLVAGILRSRFYFSPLRYSICRRRDRHPTRPSAAPPGLRRR